MNDTNAINKRIARNTLILYVRMLFGIVIVFYTSRIKLNALGAEDFGLLSVVGGVISMLYIVTNALINSTQRYLTFALGKEDKEYLNSVFMTSWFVHFGLAIFAIVIAETVGLWFLKTQLVIPPERMHAAEFVYHTAVANLFISMQFIPYSATIIAHERMSALSFFYVLGLLCNLLVVILVARSPWDKLITYSGLELSMLILLAISQVIYCNYHFNETRWRKLYNKSLAKSMGSFASWNLLGSLSGLLQTQGISILLNMFFGPLINAARAVALQAQGACMQLAGNFQTAINPQITKTYAKGDTTAMHTLVERSSRYTFILIYLLALPILLEAPILLEVWLKNVPEHTVLFLRIMMLTVIVDSMANPFMQAASATGKIKKYSIIMSMITLQTFPLAYLALKLGASPEVVFIIHLGISTLAFFVRVFIVCRMVEMSAKKYLLSVLSRIFVILVVSLPLPLLFSMYSDNTIINSLLVCAISVLSAGLSSFFLGMTRNERTTILKTINTKLRSLK